MDTLLGPDKLLPGMWLLPRICGTNNGAALTDAAAERCLAGALDHAVTFQSGVGLEALWAMGMR